MKSFHDPSDTKFNPSTNFNRRRGHMLLSLCLTAIVLLTHGTLRAADDAGDEQYNLAAGLYKKERWDLAAEQFQKFLKEYPKHVKVPYAQLYLGMSHVNLKQYGEARDILRVYVQNYPNSKNLSDAMYRVAECSYLLEDLKASAAEFDAYLKKFPDEALSEWALPYYGDALLRLDRPKEAVESFQTSLTKFPKGTLADDAKFGLAQAYEALNQGDQAEEIYRGLAADARNPRAPSAQMKLAGRQFAAKKFQEAAASYDQLVSAFPESPLVAAADLNAGFAYYQAGDFATAIARFERVEAIPEQAVTAKYWKGVSQKSLKKYPEAIATLKSLYESHPDDPLAESALYHLAGSEFASNQGEAALAHFQEVVKRWPKGELADDSLYYAAEAALSLDKLDETQQLIERFAAEYPTSGLRLQEEMLRGRVLRDRGGEENLKQALVHFEKVLAESSIPGTQMMARYYIASTHRGLNNDDAVIAILEPLIADVRQNGAKSEYIDALAVQAASLLDEKKYEETIAAASDYLKYLPDGPQAEQVTSFKAMASAYLGDATAAQHNLTILFNKYPQSPTLAITAHKLAEIMYEAQKWESSLGFFSALEKLGKESPYHAQALSGEAWCLYQEQKYEPASARFAEVLKQHPEHKLAAEAGFMQGKSLEAANQLDQALEAYHATLTKFAPAREAYLSGLQAARLLGRKGEIDKADAAYTELLKIFPEPEQLDKLLDEWALLNYEAERYEKSDEIFRRLATELPNSELADNARMSLAESDLVAGKLDDARKAFRELEAAESSDAHVREVSLYRLISIAIELEDWDDASQRAQQLEQRFPESSFIWYGRFQRAEALYRLDKIDDAAKGLEAIKAESGNEGVSRSEWFPRVYVLLAEIHLRKKEYDGLKSLVDEFVAWDSKSPFLYQVREVLGRAYKNQAKFKEAIDTFRLVIDDPSGKGTETAAKSQFMIAEIYLLQKDHKTAQLEYLKVDIHYDFPQWQAPALYQTGQCHEALKEVPLARKTYDELVQKFPDSEYAAKAKERLIALK